MEAPLHPTELCKSLSSSPLLSEEPIYPIPTCRRDKTYLTNVWLMSTRYDFFTFVFPAIDLAQLYEDRRTYAAVGLILSIISIFLIIGASFSLLTNTYDEFSFRLFSAILAFIGLIYSLIGLAFTTHWVLPVIGIPLAIYSLIFALLL